MFAGYGLKIEIKRREIYSHSMVPGGFEVMS